jgi:hypothetical protein
MATLILDNDGRRRGSVLNGRTVIGRRANSHIVIPDRSVSRVHAWIGRAGNTYFVADSGSRTGTLVNGRPVEGRRSLRDGDQIRIGPATITFFLAASLPPGIEPLLSPAESGSDEDGIFVYCACGAPIWAPWEYGGRTGRCRHCGATLELPMKPEGAAPSDPSNDTLAGGLPSPFASPAASGAVHVATELAPARIQPDRPRLTAPAAPKANPMRAGQKPASASPSKAAQKTAQKAVAKPATPSRIAELGEPPRTETICGACQSPISMLEPTTTCPDCGVAFHADCWAENRGCSSYGCKQVGVLDPQPKPAHAAGPAYKGPEIDEPRSSRSRFRAINWEPIVLPGSALVGLAGVFAFGVPSLAIVVGLVVWSVRHTPKSRRLVAAATIVSALMAAVGSALSTYWWFRP